MLILLPLLLILVLSYWAALEYLRQQWLSIPSVVAPPAVRKEVCLISLVVVVRNEAPNLPLLFRALEGQSLAPQLFELHLVDDSSTDESLQIATAFKERAAFNVNVHRLNRSAADGGFVAGGSPKKAAITQVLPHCRGNIIAVTDGDCIPGQQWLSRILSLWQQEQPCFISGPVRYVGERSLFEKMQALDFTALIGVGASMLHSGRPGMCNAANMAFSKQAFREVGGYTGNEHVPSGDDEFLLQKLAKLYPDRIAFMKAEGAVVSTGACGSWQEFVQQRKRWAGKWRLHKGIASKLPPVLVFLFYLLITFSYGLAFWQPAACLYILPLLLLKAVADYRFLAPVLNFLKKPLSLKVFLLMELVYPFYVLFFALVANTGSFTWKERNYRYTTSEHERTGVSRVG
ncbi:glycosyltransferase [Cesiribacter sp. SM1]|uniref:glycosyltransferase n=1 Tax=Cesiribacter sp. SM1 TaxID=2861196 RepID=UPI001CD48264|nr:glycosyltransferase [Cesiribacter sp. SM1]